MTHLRDFASASTIVVMPLHRNANHRSEQVEDFRSSPGAMTARRGPARARRNDTGSQSPASLSCRVMTYGDLAECLGLGSPRQSSSPSAAPIRHMPVAPVVAAPLTADAEQVRVRQTAICCSRGVRHVGEPRRSEAHHLSLRCRPSHDT